MHKHDIIKLRRGTAAEWAASEPQPGGEVLKLGEPGYEKDTKKLKIGDGITPWNSLSYISGDGGDITVDPEDIQDIIGNGFLVSGSGINISYNDNLNSLTISTSGVSFVGHAHTISEVSGLQAILDSKQPSGVYASGIHSHSSSDITNFNSSVSGLLPVTNILSGAGISVSNSSGVYTIEATGSGILSDQAKSLVTTVFNKTGSPIPKMSAVYINGGQGDLPTISLAIATSDMTSAGTYGLAYETINNMSSGRVIVFGALTGLNTDQFNPTAPTGNVNGSIVYLSPSVSGSLTLTKPSAPNHIVAIGTIVRTHQNEGIIEVRVQNGFELEELHNVKVSGVTDGQFLQYHSGSGLWVPSSSGNFTSLTVNGSGVSLSGHTHTIPDVSGLQTALDLKLNSSEVDTDLIGGPGIALLYDNINDTLSIYSNGENYITDLGALSGSNAIHYDSTTKSIQTLTLNGTAVTFTKGTGWPTSPNVSVDTVLKINVNSPTTITWTIVNDWFYQPPSGALPSGVHLVLLRAMGSSVIEGHYIGNKTN